jgi:hypothetical protein
MLSSSRDLLSVLYILFLLSYIAGKNPVVLKYDTEEKLDFLN